MAPRSTRLFSKKLEYSLKFVNFVKINPEIHKNLLDFSPVGR